MEQRSDSALRDISILQLYIFFHIILLEDRLKFQWTLGMSACRKWNLELYFFLVSTWKQNPTEGAKLAWTAYNLATGWATEVHSGFKEVPTEHYKYTKLSWKGLHSSETSMLTVTLCSLTDLSLTKTAEQYVNSISFMIDKLSEE